jgi:hypothetical protein
LQIIFPAEMLNNTTLPLRSKSAKKIKSARTKESDQKILMAETKQVVDLDKKSLRLQTRMISEKVKKEEITPLMRRIKPNSSKQNKTSDKAKNNSRPSSVEKKNQNEKSAEKQRGSSKKKVHKAPRTSRGETAQNTSTKNTTLASSSSYLDGMKSSKQNTQAGEWDQQSGQEYGIQTNYLRLKQATNRLRSRRRGMTEHTQDSSSEVSNSLNSKATVSSKLLRNMTGMPDQGGDHSKSSLTKHSKGASHKQHIFGIERASYDRTQHSQTAYASSNATKQCETDVTSDNLRELFSHAKKALKQKTDRHLSGERKVFGSKASNILSTGPLPGAVQNTTSMHRNLNTLGNNVFAGTVVNAHQTQDQINSNHPTAKVQPETGSLGSSKIARLVHNLPMPIAAVVHENREATTTRKYSGDADSIDNGVRMVHKFPVRSDSPPDMNKKKQNLMKQKKKQKTETSKDEKLRKEFYTSLNWNYTGCGAVRLSTPGVPKLLLSAIRDKASKLSKPIPEKRVLSNPLTVSQKAKVFKKKAAPLTERTEIPVNPILLQSADNFKKVGGHKEHFSKTGFAKFHPPKQDELGSETEQTRPGISMIQSSKLFTGLRTSQPKEQLNSISGGKLIQNNPEVKHMKVTRNDSSQSEQEQERNRILLAGGILKRYGESVPIEHKNEGTKKQYSEFKPPEGILNVPSSQIVEAKFKEFVRKNEMQWKEFLKEMEAYKHTKESDVSKLSNGTNTSLVRRIERVKRKAQKCLKIVAATANNEESSLGILSGEITAGLIQDSYTYGFGSSRANLYQDRTPAIDPYQFADDQVIEPSRKSAEKPKDGSAAAKLQNFLPPTKEIEFVSNPQSASHRTPKENDKTGLSYLKFSKQIPYTPFELNADPKHSQRSKKSQSSSGPGQKNLKLFDQKPEALTPAQEMITPSNAAPQSLQNAESGAKSFGPTTQIGFPNRGETGNQIPVYSEAGLYSSSAQLRSAKDSDQPHSNYGEDSVSESMSGTDKQTNLLVVANAQPPQVAYANQKSSGNHPQQSANQQLDKRTDRLANYQSGREELRIGITEDNGALLDDQSCQPTLVVSPLHQKPRSTGQQSMSRFHQHLLLEVWTNKNHDGDQLHRPRRSSGGASSSRASNRSLSDIQHKSLLHSKIDTVFGKSKTEQSIVPQNTQGILLQSSPKQLSLRPASESQSQTLQENKSLPHEGNSLLSARSPMSESMSRTEQHDNTGLVTGKSTALESLHHHILGTNLGIELPPSADIPRNQLIEIHNWYESSASGSPTGQPVGSPPPPGLKNLFMQLNSPQHLFNDPEVFISESSEHKQAASVSSGVKPLFSSKLAGHFLINEVIASQQNDSQNSARDSIQPGQETPSLLHSPNLMILEKPPVQLSADLPKRQLLIDSDEKIYQGERLLNEPDAQNCAIVLELDQVLDAKEPFAHQNISGAEESIVFSSIGEKADIITSFIMENLLVEAVAEEHCINKFIEVLGPYLLQLECTRLETYFSKLMERVLGDETEASTVLRRLNTPIGPSDLQRLMMSSPNLSEADQESLSSFLYEPVLDVKLYVSVEESLRETEYKLRELDQVQMERQHIVHKMIFDALNEVLDYKRLYGISGRPMPFEAGFKLQIPYQVSDLRRIFVSAFAKLRSWEKIKAGRLLEKDPKTKHNEPEELDKFREKALEAIVAEYVG